MAKRELDEKTQIIEEEGLYLEEPDNSKKKRLILIIIMLVILLIVLVSYGTYSWLDWYHKRMMINIDINHDGICDVNCDTNKDGKPDYNVSLKSFKKRKTPLFNIDKDGDGKPDFNLIDQDTNGDGKCDLNCDIDNDGWPETNLDLDGDGKCDLNCDTNGDGKCDLNCDTDNDQKCNYNCDTNGDGKCDLNCDTNGDGKCDLNCDTNGDGKCDLNCDTNGDGKCDLNCDTNGDGKCDLNCDTDGDGKCDKECDTDGDNKCDVNCSSADIDDKGEYSITFLDKNSMNYTSIKPGWRASKTFTVTNDTNATLKYDIYWDELINEFTETNNLYFGLIRDSKTVIDISSSRVPYPNGNNRRVLMLSNVVLNPKETHTYEITLLFKETNQNQDVDRGKTFSGKLQIVNKGM